MRGEIHTDRHTENADKQTYRITDKRLKGKQPDTFANKIISESTVFCLILFASICIISSEHQ